MSLQVQNVVSVRASRPEVMRALYSLPQASSGSLPLARQLMVRLGLTTLGLVKRAFILKADGGTDDTGLSWKPLSPHTIAYSRKHPGVPKKRPFWDTHPSIKAGKKQRERWWNLYYSLLSRYGGNKRHAASVAWIILRKEYPDFKSLMDLYGHEKVQILLDTGVLLDSLSPGVEADSASQTPPVVKNQIFRLLRGAAIVGTNRKGAASHHRGVSGKLPQRRLWPRPSQWTSHWWKEILEQAKKGVSDIAVYLVGRL